MKKSVIVTSPFNKISGENVQLIRRDSSSFNNESEPSPTRQRTESFKKSKKLDHKKQSLDDKTKDSQQTTTRMNKDEKLARAAGIRFDIKV